MILRPLSSFFDANPDFKIVFKDGPVVAEINRFTAYGSYGSFSAGIDSGSIRLTKCVENAWNNVTIETSDELLAFVSVGFRATRYNAGAFWVSYPIFPQTTLQSYVRFNIGGMISPKRFPNNFSYVFWFPKGREVALRIYNACMDLRIFPIASGQEILSAIDANIEKLKQA